MTEGVEQRVQRWLDEAATAMGGRPEGRRDALLELEATIFDRVDEKTREGKLPDEAVEDVLNALGDPAEVGSTFLPPAPLLPPSQARSYLLHTAVVFVAHFLVVVGATVAEHPFALGPVRILPIDNPRNVLDLLVRGLGTLFFDAGAVLAGYVLLSRLGRLSLLRRVTLGARLDARRCVQNACFLGLVFLVANFFRDNLLALYLPGPDGVTQIPFAGPGITSNLMLLDIWIVTAIARELFYAKRGERRITLVLDVVSNLFGLFALLRIVATGSLVDLSLAQSVLGLNADGVGALLNTVFVLLALVAAAILAGRVVRRSWRLKLLHR
ncbi:MAG TPA: hypothetical protein VFY93_07675 [Planctomycetota bacterium]|nr:hypothetical protein [Planctomycetota bacterium]